ncbi:hypothetical protein [Stenotrophomonas maltophilia]|uniref:hypothetical protein n=1 Tax=Stenotrophomonas maltophilia TaxID=40324 RepID=UPI001D122ADC|nr:hypothetical protein [Stenotrophomonas maltophilia]UXB37693.1 hypothetical protein K7563_07960 [Stenotrophomonas maltophilia]
MTTDNKTLAVDVLAVMDLAADRATLIPELSADLKQARAAVAELIEAISQYRLSASTTNRERAARLDAALARVKGESA